MARNADIASREDAVPPGPRIRAAVAADLPAIIALQARCFPTPLPAAHLQRELLINPLAEFLVAEANAAETGFDEPRAPTSIVGYLSVWWVVEEAHVSAIAVDPEWRRRGVARALMRALVERALARDIGTLTLEVREGNHAARRLYAALGLREVGRRRGYYADTGEDALILTGPLAGGGADAARARTRRGRRP